MVVLVIEPFKSKLYHPKQSCDYNILLFSILCIPSIHASWVLPPAGSHQTKGPARGIWEPWKKRRGWMGEGRGDSEKKGVENTLKKTREYMVNKGCPSCGRQTVWKQSSAPEARRPLIHSHSTYSHPPSSPDLHRSSLLFQNLTYYAIACYRQKNHIREKNIRVLMLVWIVTNISSNQFTPLRKSIYYGGKVSNGRLETCVYPGWVH